MTRALPSFVAFVAALPACGGPALRPSLRATDAPASTASPRLVVLLVVDQWPQWSFEAKRPALTGGFDRLLREGAWHTGQHPSAATLTAPGHALFGSGEPSYHSGIVANEWWHRDLDRQLKAIEDEDGLPTTKWLRVPG
ncbi:MAG TPA: alkaline phosphatase family protein, partial [Kofleriaceae bacterium]|nr:alkaline phosphatase family protein [Kofleriaceae bacterium]